MAVSLRVAIVLLILMAGGAVGAGYALFDSDDVSGNVLAEVGGAPAGALVALLVVERVLTRQRARQWGIVGRATKDMIRRHLVDIFSEYPVEYEPLTQFVGRGLEGREAYHTNTPRTMKQFVEDGRRIAPARAWDPEGNIGANHFAIALHKTIERDIQQVLEIHFPLVVTFSSDVRLAESLSWLYECEHNWRNQIIVEERIVAGDPYGTSLDFLDAAREVYEALGDAR